MNRYETAKFVTANMAVAPQFARVASGARAGTVGRIVEVRSKYWSEQEYRLAVKGRRRFWVKGETLELLEGHIEGTCYIEDKSTPIYKDTLGRELSLDQTVIFPRSADGALVEMVMGTIKKISDKGALYVRPFKIGDKTVTSSDLIRLACPNRALIIDKMTATEVMLAKLACN